MINKPKENRDQKLKRLWDAVLNYKNSVEFSPILGGKIIIPDDVQFLLEEINRLEINNKELLDAYDNVWR